MELLLTSLSDSLKQSGERAELIVVDNGSDQTDSLHWLQELPNNPAAQVLESCKVLRKPGPFNYSHLNNVAARCAKGELLCFLNNDIEIIQSDWLTVMNQLAQTESHGCVGATLLYPDNTIQHAGVVVGVETIAGHIYKHSPHESKSRGVKGRRTLKQKWTHRKAIQYMRKRWPEALQGKPGSIKQWQEAQNWQH